MMDTKQSKETELEITSDGSHTLYSRQFNQHYHNPNGAVAESKHNFFENNGLNQAIAERDAINILEIGFGTGLNLLLLADAYLQTENKPSVTYHSIEGFPIAASTAKKLNYGAHLNHPELVRKLPPLFNSLQKGHTTQEFIPGINAAIFHGLFEDYKPGNITFDFIFHDAFSPSVNPELWTGDIFKKLLQWSNTEAILTTYSAASKAKGAMAWAGWNVAQAPGALGKREMTVASPATEPLSHLKRINEKRLARRYAEGDFE